MYWKGSSREQSEGSLVVISIFFLHQQLILFNIWSVVISARVSHWPSTQEGKYTGSTYLTYFPWVSAKAQCKQAGTNLKIQITSWHAAKRIERQFLLRNYSRNMLAEAWGKVFCVCLFFFSLVEKVLKSIMSIWGGFLLLLLFLLLFKKKNPTI